MWSSSVPASVGWLPLRNSPARRFALPSSISAIIICFSRCSIRSALPVLATSEIAWPIRYLVRKRKEVTTWLGVVSGVDAQGRNVMLEDGATVSFDTLILATGVRHAYFGHDEWEAFAPGLKTLEDATSIRRRVLLALERAERELDPARRAALLTFVIIGGGPTGVELAGAIVELVYQNLVGEFRQIDTRKARVLLIEAGPRILPSFAPDLSAYAHQALERLGVEVQLGSAVTDCNAGGVVVGGLTVAADVILGPPACAHLRRRRGSGRRQTMPAASGSLPT